MAFSAEVSPSGRLYLSKRTGGLPTWACVSHDIGAPRYANEFDRAAIDWFGGILLTTDSINGADG